MTSVANKFAKNSTVREVILILLSTVLVIQSTVVTAADLKITVDRSADKRFQADISQSRNGIDVVEITTPNSTGLSHNKFTAYNVKQKGLILNNANQTVNTQLGGYINGNKNVQSRRANVILNEITGTSRSELRGFTEVAGKSADVVVANPNGIYVNGAGFINVPKATLTTGVPNFSGEKLDGFSVHQGEIEIDGAGFNATDPDRVDFYAKALKINAEIHANELNVVTGNNDIANDGTVTASNTTQISIEAFAIDSTALGGIYATKIKLIGTEEGLGVNLPVEVSAQESLKIDASGRIVLGTATGDQNGLQRADIGSTKSDIQINDFLYAERVSLSANQTITNDGVIAAKTSMEMVASDVFNEGMVNTGIEPNGTESSGVVERTLIQSDTLTNRNEIASKGKVTITVTETLKNTGSIFSKKDVDIDANAINTSGTLAADGILALTGNNLTNTTADTEGTNAFYRSGIKGNNIDIDMAGTLENSHIIIGSETVDIAASDIDNHGAIASANNLRINANNVDNYQAIYSSGDATLYVTDQLYNRGENSEVHAEGSLSLQANMNGEKTNAVVNEKGRISTKIGDINISADRFENRTENIQIGQRNTGSSKRLDFRHVIWNKDQFYENHYSLSYQAVAQNRIQQEHPELDPASGEYETLLLDYLNQYYGQYGLIVKKAVERASLFSFQDNSTATSYYVSLPGIYKERRRILNYFQTEDYLITQPIKAALSSGNNLKLNVGNFINDHSTVSSVNDIIFTDPTGIIDNRATMLYRYNKTSGRYEYCYNHCSSMVHSPDYTWANLPTTVNSKIAYDTINSSIIAGGNITGHADQLINDAGVQPGGNTTNSDPKYQSEITKSKTSGNTDPFDTLILPTNPYGIFILSPDPQGKYLIESNPAYTQYDNFIGSDYFLQHVEFDNEANLKRMGDAMYETELVSNAVMSLTGQRFIEGAESTQDQYLTLMDNAINMQGILELELGKEPTPEQLANLEEDIVWMVEHEVNGHRVLVPQLYLANDYDTLSGAIISAGEDTSLEIKGELLNTGTIHAGDDVALTARRMLNRSGSIRSEGELQLEALHDIINKDGGQIYGSNVFLTSKEGSIRNETWVGQKDVQAGAIKQTYTPVSNKSTIESTNGDLTLNARKDIVNTSAKLAAQQDIMLAVKEGNVQINTLETVTAHDQGSGNNYYRSEQVRHETNSLEAGEHLSISAGNDVNITAANLSAGETVRIDAKNDINVNAVNDVNYTDVMKSRKRSLGRKSVRRDMSYSETVQSTSIDGNNIVLTSGKDIALESAHLTAQENLIIDTANDLDIVAKTYQEGELHYRYKRSVAGLSTKESMDRSDALKLNEAKLRTEALNIILQSGNDLTVIASDIDSAADLYLKTANDFLLTSANELRNSEQWSKEESFNIVNAIVGVGTLGLASTGPIYEMEHNVNTVTDSGTKSASLKSGNTIHIDTGDATFLGSSVEAGKDINVTADTGSINIFATEEWENIRSEQKKVEISVGNLVESTKAAVEDALSNKETKIKVEIASATYDHERQTSDTTTHVGSRFVTHRGDAAFDAVENITVKGSAIEAGNGTVALIAREGNLTVSEVIDTHNSANDATHGSARLSVTVQNEYVEAARAWVELTEATKALKEARKGYREYKKNLEMLEDKLEALKQAYATQSSGVEKVDIEELTEIIEEIKSDEKYQLANIAAATANLASKTTLAMQQTATAGNSSGTYGFSVGMVADMHGEERETTTTRTQSVASTIGANNLLIKTGTDKTTILSGSRLSTVNDIHLETGSLNIVASQESYTNTSNTKTIDGSISTSIYGAGVPMADLGHGSTHADEEHTTVNNATLVAGNNLAMKVDKDANLIGANLRAGNELNAHIGGDLTVESLRDISRSNNRSNNASVGASFGTDSNPVNDEFGLRTPDGNLASVNASFDTSDRRTTQKTVVISTITGGEVNIDVDSNTHLKGSLITAGNYDEDDNFSDNGGLFLVTQNLTYEDVANITYASNDSMSASGGVAFGDTGPMTGDQKAEASSVTLQLAGGIQYDRSKSLATVGQGNLIIQGAASPDEIALLNRNAENTEKGLFDVDHKKVDIDMTLDTRLLSEEGREEIKEDARKAGEEVQKLDEILPSATNDKPLLATAGKTLNLLNTFTLGIIPSDDNDGGVIAQVPVLLGQHDRYQKVVKVVSQDTQYFKDNPDDFIKMEDSDYYKNSSAGIKRFLDGIPDLYVSKEPIEIDTASASYQNATNGIMNNEAAAIKNAITQTHTKGDYENIHVNLNYNPTHGFIGDMLESGVDLFGGTTGMAEQTGEFIRETTTARGMRGSNFVPHSQGNILTISGVEYIKAKGDYENGGFMPREYFIDEAKVNKKDREAGLPTFAAYGSPMNTETIANVIQGETGDELFVYKGMVSNKYDFVSEVLGGNKGQNQQMSILGRVISIPTFLLLFTDQSPHGNYNCDDVKGAMCGSKP